MTNDTLAVRGHYRLTLSDVSEAIEEYVALMDFLRMSRLRDKFMPGWREKLKQLTDAFQAKAAKQVLEWDNLCPTIGRAVIAQRLGGVTTYTGTVNYLALGSGTTTPTNGDTTLATESYRSTITSATVVNSIAYLSVFIPAGTATATHYEGGLFIDGTAAADSGQLLSRVLFSPPVDKTALNSLSLDISLSVS